MLLVFFVALCAAWGGANAAVTIRSLHIISEIQARFAVTDTIAELENGGASSDEVVFTATLPDRAYVSNFSMEIDGNVIYGEVQDAEGAKDRYDAAKSRGETASLVRSKPRETNVFEVRANVAGRRAATFNMTYQEVLRREHGAYKHVVNVQPPYPIDDLQVDVLIAERERFTRIHVPKYQWNIGKLTNKELLRLQEDPNVEVRSASQRDGSIAYVFYKPEVVQNNKGQLVVLYDVERDYSGGEIETLDGYFVHFIAPDTIPAGNKHVVFVLDTSGSMKGRKMAQMKSAMRQILADMSTSHPADYFNVLLFSNDVRPWRSSSQAATRANTRAATDWIEQQDAVGGTNIHAALTDALERLDGAQSLGTLANMVLFLTDGQPTVGVTDESSILNSIDGKQPRQRNDDRFAINTVAFGSEPNFDFIRTIADDNLGLARRIYVDSDAGVQLQGFYDQVATPLITNMRVKYHGDNIEPGTLIKQDGKPLFSDGEVMVVGKMKQANRPLKADVTGRALADDGKSVTDIKLQADSGRKAPCYPDPKQVPRRRGGFSVPATRHIRLCGPQMDEMAGGDEFDINGRVPAAYTVAGYIERMWAYMTVQKHIEDSKSFSLSQDEKDKAADRALELSLKYGLVTELTSMVVVLPDGTDRRLQMHSSADSTAAGGRRLGPLDEDADKGAGGGARGVAPPPDVGGGTRGIGASGGAHANGDKCPTEVTFLYDNAAGRFSLFAPARTSKKVVQAVRDAHDSKAKFQFGRIAGASERRQIGLSHQIKQDQSPSAIEAAVDKAIEPKSATSVPSRSGLIRLLRYTIAREPAGGASIVIFTDNATALGRLASTLRSMRTGYKARPLFVNTSGRPFTAEKRAELEKAAGGPEAVLESSATGSAVTRAVCSL